MPTMLVNLLKQATIWWFENQHCDQCHRLRRFEEVTTMLTSPEDGGDVVALKHKVCTSCGGQVFVGRRRVLKLEWIFRHPEGHFRELEGVHGEEEFYH